MTPGSKLFAHVTGAASILIGGVSMVLFVGYPRGLIPILPRDWSLVGVLAWDAMLSAVFFLQHSLMIRASVRTRLQRVIRPPHYMALYSVASGAALILATVLWQSSGVVAYRITGGLDWALKGLLALAAAGFLWGALSLRPFDPLGIVPLRAYVRGMGSLAPVFTVSGPYRWVRHPLYSFMIAILWLNPRPSLDVLFGGALWTAWIVWATFLEERDLTAQFGHAYRQYARRVPMFVPWRGRLKEPRNSVASRM